ncbi:cytochrome P450 6k1-like [Leguminivora glycinivorella]|uniref:cytochrome P450 6k1-like n=1 Tax=Leguminivora glycinivorella TaxID=1035111 RepID=UPI00200F72F0|nr:cytochrome P450 6k1-like [Leguminivora glycinivorella]
MSATQYLLAAAVTAFIALCWVLRDRYDYWKKRGIPYVKPIYLIGNLSFVMRKSVFDFFLELSKKYPTDCVGMFLGLTPTLVVQTPELARKVLVKDYGNFEDRFLYSGHADPLGSLNLFTVKNPIWASMRQELTPMFTSARLRKVTELMNMNAAELVKRVQRNFIERKEDVNLKEVFSMYASDTVAFTVFGIRISRLSDQDSPLWFITSHMVKWTFWRGLEFSTIFFLPFLAKLLRLQFFSGGATEYIRKLFWGVVAERNKTGVSSDKDLVNHLLKLKENVKLPAESGSKLADDLMLAQAAVFILGSIETSSTTLSYTLHELAHHPEEQEKLFNEIDTTLKEKGKEILDYDNLLELKYLSSCISETMRKNTPVPYLERKCKSRYQLTDDIVVEAGTPVFVNVMALHFNEKYHEEPEKWRPERFANPSDNDNKNFTFLPFGEGPHFCIGKRYGLMQVRAALAQLLHKYRVEPVTAYELKADPYAVFLAPANGGSVRFVPRT